jgi:hypothetical protein
MDDFGWKVHAHWRPEMDHWEVYVVRRVQNVREWATVGADGDLVTHRAGDSTPMLPLLAAVPFELLQALSDGLALAVGAPLKQQLLEGRAAGAEAKFEYAKGLNDRLLTLVEKQLLS